MTEQLKFLHEKRLRMAVITFAFATSCLCAFAAEMQAWKPDPAQIAQLEQSVPVENAQIRPVKGLILTAEKYPDATIATWRSEPKTSGMRSYLQLAMGLAGPEQSDLNKGLELITNTIKKSLSLGGDEHTNLTKWLIEPGEDGLINGIKFRRGRWTAQDGDKPIYGFVYIAVTPKGKAVAMSSVSEDIQEISKIESSVQTFQEP